jgi:serine/threonine protein kinase
MEDLGASPEFIDLVSQCLEMDPTKCITAEQALQHIFYITVRQTLDEGAAAEAGP